MNDVVTCFLVMAGIAGLLVPFVIVIAHARKLSTLQTALQKLSARMESLETQMRGAAPAPAVPPAHVPAPAASAAASPAASVLPVVPPAATPVAPAPKILETPTAAA